MSIPPPETGAGGAPSFASTRERNRRLKGHPGSQSPGYPRESAPAGANRLNGDGTRLVTAGAGPPLHVPVNVSWVPSEVAAVCARVSKRLGWGDLPSLGVTSARRREGRSTVAAGLALAQRNVFGRRTVLVELDAIAPSLGATLGLSGGPGLAEAMRGTASISDCIVWEADGLGVLPVGTVDEDAAAFLSRLSRTGLLQDIGQLCDVVVADLPALPPAGPADIVAQLFGAVVLVVRGGSTPLPVVTAAADALMEPPAVILNRVESTLPRWLQRRFGG
jgi:Mrp family chromosome partitioning ATPase